MVGKSDLFVRDGRTSALIGYTGYVGGNLRAQADFTDFYNTANISELAGKHYDTIVCAGAPGFKIGANNLNQDIHGRVYDDSLAMASLVQSLAQARCGRFILISTISVYAVTSDEELRASRAAAMGALDTAAGRALDEGRDVWDDSRDTDGQSYSVYGRNRAALERWVRAAHPSSHLLVRLPGIFGPGIKKNYIFDLMTRAPWVRKIRLNTRHQVSSKPK
jgi:nucleoside-diphosphate-sugar epimerase